MNKQYFILSNDDKHYIGGEDKGGDIPKTSNKKDATTFIWNKNKTGFTISGDPSALVYDMKPVCEKCSEHGTCYGTVCHCDKGWTGENCTVSPTPPTPPTPPSSGMSTGTIILIVAGILLFLGGIGFLIYMNSSKKKRSRRGKSSIELDDMTYSMNPSVSRNSRNSSSRLLSRGVTASRTPPRPHQRRRKVSIID